MNRRAFFIMILSAIFGKDRWAKIVQHFNPKPVPVWDPVLISLVRKSFPKLIAYDLCGVQPILGGEKMNYPIQKSLDFRYSSDI